jgi:hypothetical protein
MTGTPWLLPHHYFKKEKDRSMKSSKKEKADLESQVYQLVNGIRDVPAIAIRIFGEDAKVGTTKFYRVCDAVDKLIEEGLVYFKDSGVLIDLQR